MGRFNIGRWALVAPPTNIHGRAFLYTAMKLDLATISLTVRFLSDAMFMSMILLVLYFIGRLICMERRFEGCAASGFCAE
jgi:hypothetical protein